MVNEMGNQNINGLQASEQEGTEVTKTINEHGEAFIMSNDKHRLKVSKQQDTGTMATNRSSDPRVVSTDADDEDQSISYDKNQSISSMEFDGLHEERQLFQNISAAGDNLIQRQATERREEEETISVPNSSSETDQAVTIPSINLKPEEQEPIGGICHESTDKCTKELPISNEDVDEKSDELQCAIVEGLKECVTPDTNSIVVDNMQILRVEESGSCGEMVLMNNDVEGNTEDGKQPDIEIDLVPEDCTPLQKKNVLLTEPISFAYLHAIDSEIQRLLIEDEHKAVDESFKTETYEFDGPNQTCPKHDEETSQEDIEGFVVQRKASNPNYEEEQNRHDHGSEDSVIDLVQTDERKDMESRQEDHDHNLNMVPEESNKDMEGEEILEMGRATLAADKLAPEREEEDAMDNKSEKSNDEHKLMETTEINGETSCDFSPTLADPIIGANEERATETGELLTTGNIAAEITIASRGSDDESKLLNKDTKGEGYSASSPCLLDPVGSPSEEMVKKREESNATENTKEERSEQLDGEFGGHTEVADATLSVEQMYQTNIIDIERRVSPKPSNKDFIYAQESEQKENAKKFETPASEDGLITESADISEYRNVCSEMSCLADETFVLAIELENKKHSQGENCPPVSKMMIQPTEVSEVKYNELILNPNMQSQNKDQECNPLTHVVVISDITREALKSNGRSNSESNQQKVNLRAEDTTTATDYLEKLVVETAASASQPQNENYEGNPLPIYELERYGDETEEKSMSNASSLEVRAEEAEQNPSLDYKQAMENNVFAFEKCVPEINESIKRCHINKRQEVFSKVGAQTVVSVLESTNEESDKSPLLYKKSRGDSEASRQERTDSEKLKTPFISFIKEEAHVLESCEKKESLDLKKTMEEVRASPAKKIVSTSPKQRGKQKPRSSLFSNCMCCTTALN